MDRSDPQGLSGTPRSMQPSSAEPVAIECAWIATRPARWLALAAIVGLALALRLIRLDHSGFITPYYAAAVRSMSENWHNFLYAAFDPFGFLAIDKPPVAFWAQVLGVKIFGFDAFALRLPQVLEGVAAVGLLHHLVARRFGIAAGLLAALFLAVTPLSVAVDRSNNTDGCLVLVMLLAAWPLAIAAERASLGLLLAAAAILGIGFNVKMLAAMVVAPAFIAVYWFGAPASWRRRAGHLVAAGAILAVVSLSWTLVSELTPPADRPYVDSTQDNSELELAIGHNAMDRFVRPAWRRIGVPERRLRGAAGADTPFRGAPAGAFRLADPRLASQVAWLLPLAVGGVLLGAGRARPWLPLDPSRQGVALWAAWAAVSAVVYSAAGGIFQPYYLAPLAPALSALAAICVTRLRTAAAVVAALLATAAWQAMIVWSSLPLTDLLVWVGTIPVIGALLASGMSMAWGRRTAVALAFGVAALLAAPGAWIAGTLLASGPGGAPIAHIAEGPRFGLRSGPLAGNQRLLAYLAENRGGARWLLATVTAREAAPIIMRTGAPVLAMGGFIGSIPILTADDLARLVADGDLRFVMLAAAPRGGVASGGAARDLRAWVIANGRPVAPEAWRMDPPAQPGPGAARRGDPQAAPQLYDLSAAGPAPS